MIDLLLKIHWYLYTLNERHRYKDANRCMWIYTNVGYRLCEGLLYLYLAGLRMCRIYPKKTSNKSNAILSFTSYPARIKNVWMVIHSLIRQSVVPQKIILYLSLEDFPEGRKNLPKRLLGYEKLGLEISFKKENLLSHKKYYYAFKEFKDKNIITVDDDIIYPSDMVASLMKWHSKYPEAVICRYSRQIAWDQSGEMSPYVSWNKINEAYLPRKDIFFGSGGGTLFPSGMKNEELLNKEMAMSLCRYADDIWLNTMCRLNKVSIVPIEKNCVIFSICNYRISKLKDINVKEGLNDLQLKKVREYVKDRYFDPYLKE